MEIFANLCTYWKNVLTELCGDIDKLGYNSCKVALFIDEVDTYMKSIRYYEDIEQDLPKWLVDEMAVFFKQLLSISLNPKDWSK